MKCIDSVPLLGSIPRAAQLSLGVAVFYGSMSVSLALLNKAILSVYNFQCYFILLSVQLMLSLGFCVVSRDWLGNPFDVAKLQTDVMVGALPMAAVYVLNVALGFVGLQLVNVPMFFCIRRLVAPLIIFLEWVLLGKTTDRGTLASVALIVTGTILAGYESLGHDALGYVITLCNNLATAALFIMQKRFSTTRQVSAFSIVYYNALIALPITLIAVVVNGEIEEFTRFPSVGDPRFWFGFLVSSAMGLLLTYSSMLCTTYNSPLATSITGNAKDIITTTAGWLLFGGLRVTASSLSGLACSFCGAFLYSYVGLQKQYALHAAATSAAKAGGEGSKGAGALGLGASGPSGSSSSSLSSGSDSSSSAAAQNSGSSSGIHRSAGSGLELRGSGGGSSSPRHHSSVADAAAAAGGEAGEGETGAPLLQAASASAMAQQQQQQQQQQPSGGGSSSGRGGAAAADAAASSSSGVGVTSSIAAAAAAAVSLAMGRLRLPKAAGGGGKFSEDEEAGLLTRQGAGGASGGNIGGGGGGGGSGPRRSHVGGPERGDVTAAGSSGQAYSGGSAPER